MITFATGCGGEVLSSLNVDGLAQLAYFTCRGTFSNLNRMANLTRR